MATTLKITLVKSTIGRSPRPGDRGEPRAAQDSPVRGASRHAGRARHGRSGQAPAGCGGSLMKLHHLKPAEGSKKRKIRVGRGEAAGAARPPVAAPRARRRAARSVPGSRVARLPLQRRLPKLKGFKNRNKEYFAVVNVERSTDFERIRSSPRRHARARAGEEARPHQGPRRRRSRACAHVHAHAFSLGAVEKIKAAGGSSRGRRVTTHWHCRSGTCAAPS